MRLLVAAVGLRMPDWVDAAWDIYARRFPAHMPLQLLAVKAESRNRGKSTAQIKAAEAQRLRACMGGQEHVVALDERGKNVDTAGLARALERWQHMGSDTLFIIGGADGLDADLRRQAHECLRLSDLTLPHAMVRVLLAEQLYRAWTLVSAHPYHRA